MDMAENTGASQPRLCNTQPSPAEPSQVVSGQSSEMPTWKQTVVTSASCSTQEAVCTQNSTAHAGKAFEFHFGEPNETSSLNQQKKFPAGPQFMQLNGTPKTCLSHPQKTAVLDIKDTLNNEGYWVRTLSPDKTVLIQNTGLCESQTITSGDHQIALSGSHAGHDSNVDHSLPSINDQTLSGDLEMTFKDDQTSYYSQLTTRDGGLLSLYGNQMTAPNYSQALHPSQILTFSEQNPLGDLKRNLIADNRFYGDQMITPNGYQIFYEPQKIDNCDQIKHDYQMTSFSGQNVCRSQENFFSGEYSLSGYQTSGYRCDQNLTENHQVTSPIGVQLLYDFQMPISSFDTTFHGTKRTTSSAEDNLDCHPETSPSSEETFYLGQMRISVDHNVCPSQNGTPKIEESLDSLVTSLSNQAPYVGESSYTLSFPVIQRQPQESSSPSGLIQGQHPEMKLDLKTQSPVSQKTCCPLKRYYCTYQDCKKSYTKSYHLKDHMKKHTGEKAYACNEPGCTWKFFRLCDLNRHKKKHSGVRPYPCLKCNKRYSRLNYLNQHLKSHTQASHTTAT
ncbi:Kruppel-like factor 18 [Grammomys surdaster]|uniref:Kruppel-like factor 18 n=1 Tax=Grammomys surdaster TaxID=491861 RepID=UPI0010A03C16|nr:Kruppel-like factor 18 [Grammomys surdaster]